eukprot:scaffold4793_cov175-Amphora_coffeaeformis.AAC.7
MEAGPFSNIKDLDKQYLKFLRSHRAESAKSVGLTAFISEDWLQFSRKCVQRTRSDQVDTIDASNLGLVSIKAPSSDVAWKIQGLWMVHGRQNPAPALKACCVTMDSGSTNLVLSSLPPHFTKEDLLSVGSLCQVLLRMEYIKQTKV